MREQEAVTRVLAAVDSADAALRSIDTAAQGVPALVDRLNALADKANALEVEPGGIILLHEGYATTLAAIPQIVNGLADQGLCAGKVVPTETPVEVWPGTSHYAEAAHW